MAEARKNDNIECGKCEKLVCDSEYARCCEICDLWYHVRCEKVPVEVYNYYLKDEQPGQQFHWNCSSVTGAIKEMTKLVDMLVRGQQDLADQQEVVAAELGAVSAAMMEVKEIKSYIYDKLREISA